MPTPRARAWRRIQEQPMELTVAAFAAISGATNLLTRWPSLTLLSIALYAVLVVGGVALIAGRLCDAAEGESAGLVLVAAGFLFLLLRALHNAENAAQLVSYLLRFAALAIGFGIRLRVVRKAARARRPGGAS